MVNILGLAKGGLWIFFVIPLMLYVTLPISDAIIQALSGSGFYYNLFMFGNYFIHLIVLLLGFYIAVWGVPSQIEGLKKQLGG